MCDAGQTAGPGPAGSPGQVASPQQALAMLTAAHRYLTTLDVASLPTVTQAELLHGLAAAESRHTAAHARALMAFNAQSGYQDDGRGSAKAWLVWHTRTTRPAAAAAAAWARRLSSHPLIADALAAGELSTSWARRVCEWSDLLPEDRRADADEILLAAARSGATLGEIGGLAAEIYARTRTSDPDHGGEQGEGDDGLSADRSLHLATTFRGAGRVEGDLTPGCAAALGAVLDALGKKAGPEDTRSAAQRRHDALEDACRRLGAAKMLPDRAGQPTQVQVHMSLRDLLDLARRHRTGPPATAAGGPSHDGTHPASCVPATDRSASHWAERRDAAAEDAWRQATQPGWLTGPAARAAACDATLIPTVTGHLDWAALSQLTEAFLATTARTPAKPAPGGPAAGLSPATQERLAQALLGLAIKTLSGPAGIAAQLRTRLTGPLASPSLPLDTGTPSSLIPPHLRRAAMVRHPWCAFPGCATPATACDIHHLVPRADGGGTALHNLVPLCHFHHLVAVHTWGWRLRLNPDGTTTATGPDGRTLHSHSPPRQAA